MTESPHYTDHLIAALRCLDDDNLRKLAHEIMGRLADKVLQDSRPSEAEEEAFESRMNRNLEP